MKEIKKESLKIFSKSNLKNLVFIIIIKTTINLFLIFMFLLSIYSLLDLNLTEENFFYLFAKYFSAIKNLDTAYFSIIITFVLIYSFIMFIPLNMGIYLWFSKIKKDDKTPLLTIFYYYKNLRSIIKTVSFKLLMILKSFAVFIFCFVPTVGTFIVACLRVNFFSQESQTFFRLIILISAAIILIATIFFLKFKLSQSAANFIFVLNETANVFTIIKSSTFLMHTNSKDFTKFLLSFWQYIILCLLIIPIPFVFAYFKMCMHEFTKKIVYKQNQGIIAIPLTQKVIDINL